MVFAFVAFLRDWIMQTSIKASSSAIVFPFLKWECEFSFRGSSQSIGCVYKQYNSDMEVKTSVLKLLS